MQYRDPWRLTCVGSMLVLMTSEYQFRAAGLVRSTVPKVNPGDALDWIYGCPLEFCVIRNLVTSKY